MNTLPTTESRTPSPRPSASKCPKCGESVYTMDEVGVDGVKYHKSCLKCEVCKRIVTPGNYASLDGTFYCKPHFKQSFALKGNYQFSPKSEKAEVEKAEVEKAEVEKAEVEKAEAEKEEK